MSRYVGAMMPALFVGPKTSPQEREAAFAEVDRVMAENRRAAEERRKLAVPVIASLRGYKLSTLETVGRSLELGGGPLAGVGRVLRHVVDGREEYATVALACCLLGLARDDELYRRLEGAEEPPWPALVAALEAIREDMGES